jgi:hypothetical protein
VQPIVLSDVGLRRRGWRASSRTSARLVRTRGQAAYIDRLYPLVLIIRFSMSHMYLVRDRLLRRREQKMSIFTLLIDGGRTAGPHLKTGFVSVSLASLPLP